MRKSSFFIFSLDSLSRKISHSICAFTRKYLPRISASPTKERETLAGTVVYFLSHFQLAVRERYEVMVKIALSGLYVLGVS